MEMSLHRIIAEIKSAEQKLAVVSSGDFVFMAPADNTQEIEEATKMSQSAFDKYNNLLSNLATLKAARNRANATTAVTIAGRKMTIDEALAQKAANAYRLLFLNTMRSQMTNGKTRVEAVQAQIETRIAQQVAAASQGTKKASDAEVEVFRSLAERNTKQKLVTFPGLTAKVEEIATFLEQFATEVDYVLSEANAMTKVEVVLA